MVRRSDERRSFLAGLGKAVLGVLGGGFLAGTAARTADAGVFAGRFLKDREPIRLPPGYYDAKSQLFRDCQTGEAMFVEEAAGPVTPLSPEELGELLRSGRFVDVSAFPKVKVAASTTSTQTTLSTTSCCPIVTDRAPDSVTDD